MKKNFKVILIILSLIVLILPITYAYAIDEEETEQAVFEISSLEVTKNEKIEIKININQIQYNKFIFTLKSDGKIANIETEEEIEVEKENDEIKIEIDKETTNLNEIILYYEIPEEKQINDVIKFTATILNTETEEEEVIELEVKIVEEMQEEISDNEENPKEDILEDENDNKQEESEKVSVQNSNLSTQVLSSSTTQKTETVTYNGSDNNYLSELSVENYSLNKEFSKENTTYFINIENDITVLEITAESEDDEAIVCIYGNEDLEEGNNKILISVTAENGNVRNYRIYVTKN